MSDEKVELRGMIGRETVGVLDAVSMARRMSRIELAEEILAVWAAEQIHIASVIQAVTRVNPRAADARRNASGSAFREGCDE